MYGEMYKDALSPVICVIVRRHLSTLIRTATFEIPDQLPIRINPTIDSNSLPPDCSSLLDLPVVRIATQVHRVSPATIRLTSINSGGRGTKKRTTPHLEELILSSYFLLRLIAYFFTGLSAVTHRCDRLFDAQANRTLK